MGLGDRIMFSVFPQNILNKILFNRHLTMSICLLILDGRNPASPAAERMRRLRLNMSQEKMDAQRVKERLLKNAKRHEETQEDSTRRRKINCEYIKRKRLFETQEESDQRKKIIRDCVAKQRQTETEEQGAKRKKTKRDFMAKQRWTETEEQGVKRKKAERESKKRIREEKRHKTENERRDCNREDMSNIIDRSTKEAKQFLHRTRDPANPQKHRAIVCIICDRFIIGTETINKLTKKQIGAHSGRLGVKSYEEYYQTTLKAEVRRQYQVQGLQDMLLSPRSRKYSDGYATCSVCFSAMQPQMASKKTPPKFAIANGFVIGSFPQEITFINKEGQIVTRKVEDEELTDTLKAMVAPLRPYGCIFAYSGGAQKSLRGNYQFFEMDQNRLGGVMNHLNQAGIGEHIYCVLCGRMTPDQKQIIRRRSRIVTQLYIDIVTWFIKESGHPGYLKTSIPEDCPQPVLVEDNPTKNNDDDPSDKTVENNYEGGTYHFSSAQDPSHHTSVYGSSDTFALAMFQRSAPTLLAHGGTYAKNTDMKIENILPFAFPFGIGGPKMERRVKVSLELCIQVYLRLSLKQFMEGPTILVLNHIFNRQMSYKTGVMTCRSTIDGVPLGEKLSTLTKEDFDQISNNNNDNLNATTKSFLRAISTTCNAMGHTEQAAKHARRRCFAMLDFFGLNSLFMSTTPDDECSFRVRLYCKPQYWVSFGGLFLNGIVRLYCNLDDTEYANMKYTVFSNWKFCVFYNASSLIYIY